MKKKTTKKKKVAKKVNVEKLTEQVKDLLNQAVILIAKSTDEYLCEVQTTLEQLLASDEDESKFYDSEQYYDSGCSWDPKEEDNY